jgi:hypothetical protein
VVCSGWSLSGQPDARSGLSLSSFVSIPALRLRN